jgi:hypothetical protein
MKYNREGAKEDAKKGIGLSLPSRLFFASFAPSRFDCSKEKGGPKGSHRSRSAS